MNARTFAASLALTLVLTGSAPAADLSIFDFPEGVFAVAPARGRLHRVAMPGGDVKATHAHGALARVDMTEGMNIVASVPFGVAGRQIHHDLGAIKQVEMGTRIALVTGQEGTGLYYPGADRLMGVKLSDGYPKGVMVHRDIAAVRWSEVVAFYGFRDGYLIQLVFQGAGLQGIHVGEDTVVTMWGPEQGTFLHILEPQGFRSIRLSYERPGSLSSRGGVENWAPIHGVEEAGSPLPQLVPFGNAGPGILAVDPAAFADVSQPE